MRKLIFALAVFGASLWASNSFAVNCSGFPQYSDSGTYSTGAQVQNNGRGYQCTVGGWCTIGGPYAPGVGWAWTHAWSDLGACDGGGSSSSGGSSSGGSSSGGSSSGGSSSGGSSSGGSSSGGGSCAGLPVWSSSTVYTGGNEVQHNGVHYRAKWWTQGEDPSQSGQWGVWENLGNCSGGGSSSGGSSSGGSSSGGSSSGGSSSGGSSSGGSNGGGSGHLIGYFAQWGIYGRNYHVKNIDTSGSASRLTHIMYAFGDSRSGTNCVSGDTYADYDRFYGAAESVAGTDDSWDTGALRGSFNQLRQLKAKHPQIKVVMSMGGWTWSGGFGVSAANATTFANNCYNFINDSRWADVFDGIDIDWEYPNACGLTCDSSGPNAHTTLMQALRSRFGSQIVSAAVTADATSGGKIDASNYGAAAQHMDFVMVMTYDFFGAFSPSGPTAPHSPLFAVPGNPDSQAGFNSDAAIQKYKSKGVPASKLLLGIGFYGRGWNGVSQLAPGGSATGAAPGTYEAGIEDYKVLVGKSCQHGTTAGTHYAKCGSEWWGYDRPSEIAGKMNYVNQQGLGGRFFWEFSGDTSNGTLINAM